MFSSAYYPPKSPKGFTLIEVMIAIAIVAVLSTIGLVIYAQAQKQARISKRINDLKAIRTALEIYKSANNGSYPTPTTTNVYTPCASASHMAGDINPLSTVTYMNNSTAAYIPNLAPTYMTVLPNDPSMSSSNTGGCYGYSSNGTDYKVIDTGMSSTEMSPTYPGGDFATHPELFDPERQTGTGTLTLTNCVVGGTVTAVNAWAIYTPGACGW